MTLQTPMGPQEMTLHLVRNANTCTCTGRIESPMGSELIRNGQIDGNTLAWTMDVKKPMPIKLKFEAQVQGDTLTGHAKLGVFGTAQMEGRRL